MSIYAYIAITVGVVALVYFIFIFNNLVTLKNNVFKSFSNIDVLLKQRHDELPKLVETCKQYMGFEKDTLIKITETRASVMSALQAGDIAALGKAEGTLRQGLMNLFAVAENYPDLKTNTTFRHLQDRISVLENAIADRREVYNEATTLNNIRIEQFPDMIIAKLTGFKKQTLLEFTEAEKAEVDIKQLFQ
jgi:LemA protein